MKSPVRGGQSSSDGEAGSEPGGSTVVELDGNRKPSVNDELSNVSYTYLPTYLPRLVPFLGRIACIAQMRCIAVARSVVSVYCFTGEPCRNG